MNKSKREITSYFENMSLFFIGAFLLTFPLLFLSITTDAFVLPKQVALIVVVTLFAILFAVKSIFQGRLSFRTSPFDAPVTIFTLVLFLSAVLSTNRYDALIAFVPYLFMAFLYFAIVNIVRGQKQLFFLLASLVLGAILTSIVSILSFFKIYLLPFAYAQNPAFNTFGSLLDQTMYFAMILPIAGYFVYNHVTARRREEGIKQSSGVFILFTVGSVLTGIAVIGSLYLLFTSQKPLILPLEIGLQTGFASISQDAGNIFKSFLLGSGVGTFLTDFTRFKAATYNQYDALWSFTFFRSSSFALELLATTGLLGIGSFLFLVYKVLREKNMFLPLLLAIIAAFVLPFSFTPTLLLYVLLAIFAVTRVYANPNKHTEVTFYFMNKRHAASTESTAHEIKQKRYGVVFSLLVTILLLVVIAGPLYFAGRFFISDLLFQRSLIAASQNQGLQTYNLQIASIKMFPYRDVYYRAFSQTNLALANSLVTQNREASPSAEVQKNILTLIQQSINAGRSATTVAPLTAFNWNNLSSIYRSLIGFGENADQFALLTSQQAIALDPTNPQQYIELGGIYYQLGAYDEAIRQFQYAIRLKNNYANAYYNLGHALEMKGDLNGAMQAYEVVKKIIGNDEKNQKIIDTDIDALKKKIGEAQKQQTNKQTNVEPASEDEKKEPLNVNETTTQLPERDPRVSIPAPTVSPVPSKASTRPGANTTPAVTTAPTTTNH